MKKLPKVVDQIIAGIRKSRSICVVGHIRPDGDCIGSQLGLTLALRAAGKQVTCWNQDPMPQKLAFLDPAGLVDKPRKGGKFDCVIATDCASFERLGTACDAIAERKLFINIDHHTSNTAYGDLNWISDREASTGELIFKLMKAANWPITPDALNEVPATPNVSLAVPSTPAGVERTSPVPGLLGLVKGGPKPPPVWPTTPVLRIDVPHTP